MTCDSCIYTIDSKISKKPGIRSISVDLKTEICAVIYDPNVTAPDFIIDYVHDLNEGKTNEKHSGLFTFALLNVSISRKKTYFFRFHCNQ